MGSIQLREARKLLTRVAVQLLTTSAVTLALGAEINAAALQPGARVRSVPDHYETTIESRLLPDDEIVFIDRSGNMGDLARVDGRRPTVDDFILEAVWRADLVVIAKLRETGGVLTDDGTWVETAFNVDVTRTVRVINQIEPPKQLEVRISGGEAKIGRVVVRAAWEGFITPLLPTGASYLLFLERRGGVYVPTHTPLRVAGKSVRYPWPRPSALSPRPLERLSLNEIIDRVNRVKVAR